MMRVFSSGALRRGLMAASAAGFMAVSVLGAAPAIAADNAAVQGVSAFPPGDGLCTAANPTIVGLRFRIDGTVDDTGTGNDRIETYILDSTNAVVWNNSGNISATLGVTSSFNAFQLQVGTPVDAPFTAIVVDSTVTGKIFAPGEVVNLSDARILASGNVDMNSVDSDCPGGQPPDTTPPTVATVLRNNPAVETTDADTLTWRVTFSETVQNVNAADFTANGTSGTVSNVNTLSGAAYDVTVSGGDLAGLVNTVVSLGFAGGQNIQDAAGNALVNTTPGTNQTYTVNNVVDTTPPTVALTTATPSPTNAPFTVTATFSEDVTGFDVSDLNVGNGAASNFQTTSASVYTATITPAADGAVTVDVAASAAQDGANNASTAATQLSVNFDGTAPTATISSTASGTVGGAFDITVTFSEDVAGFTQGEIAVGNGAVSNFQQTSGSTYTATITPAADGQVTVDVAAAVATDAAGNDNTAATQFTITKVSDATPPSVTLSTSATSPVNGPFDVTATFSEDVTGFDGSDLQVTNGTASNLQMTSASVYTATITPTADGNVVVNIPAGAAQDAASNASLAATPVTIAFDGTAPTVTLTSGSTDPVSGTFTITATFSEDVTGFEVGEFTIGNGAASNFNAVSATVYTATITPAGDGQVTVDVAPGVAADAAGNANTAATQFTITNDQTAPVPTLTLPGATTEGPFTATFAFSEDVTGFDLSDISVANGAASGFVMANARSYSATITPDTVGQLTVSLAANAAQDGAGNASTAASESLNVVFPSTNSNLNLAGNVIDPTSVNASVNLTNPGSQAIGYSAASDVAWATATPASGTIPGSGALNLSIGLTAAADQLSPGVHNGTITVSSTAPAATIATIPVQVTVAPRFGTIQIVATTPGGLQGDNTFTYASADADLGGLSLTTSGGTASSASFRKTFGTYDITQSLPVGWELDSLTCAGDTDGGSVINATTGRADIDLDANETIVCTFVNSRDDAAVRLATSRAINNYLVRRGDRILSAQPDIASRLRARNEMRPGNFTADASRGEIRVAMNGSLSGLINHAQSNRAQMPGDAAQQASRFDAWFAADYSSLSDDRAGDSAESEFGILQFGFDFALDDQTVLGVMIQRDWMDETQETIATAAGGIAPAQIDGAGWMAGPYLAHQMDNGVIVDVLALFGQSDNDINPLGFYTDSFETNRYLLRANISGEWVDGPWRVRPSASISHFEETQETYTDSLGIVIPEQSVSIGRFTAGPEVAYRTELEQGGYWEVHGQLNANFDYNPASLMDQNGRVFDTGQFRADAALGVRSQFNGGAVASFEVNLSGFGEDDFEATGARFEIRVPFGG
ncbi:Ig-like domain-containing protein [Hyphobacterium sp.]|uniref:Ig-like domain-containing protein n=1 Tax=Hyphobacterium sp. TaxID=2004662 RepID=UPI003BA8DA66